WPLIRYSLSPDRKLRRPAVTSVNSEGSHPALLSITSDTSAICMGARPSPPAKMMSSLFLPRSWRMLCSPSTHRIASARFDFPLPLGPTIAVMPGLNSSTVRGAKLLNPCNSRRLRYTPRTLQILHKAMVHVTTEVDKRTLPFEKAQRHASV